MFARVPDEAPDNVKEILNEHVNPLIDEICKQVVRLELDPDITLKQLEDIKRVVMWVGERRVRSALLGEHILPCDTYPDGVILLHIDAIMDCAKAVDVPFDTLIASTLLHEIHHWKISRGQDKEYVISEKDEDHAEDFAQKGCQTLYENKVISSPMKNLRGHYDTALSFLLWLREWTGMTPDEWEQAMHELYR